MRSRRLFADSLGVAGALRRLVGLLLLTAITAGLFGVGAASAEGREISPAEYEGFRQNLLNADSGTKVSGQLGLLLKTSRATHANVYGQIVGVLLSEDARTAQLTPERRRMLFAALIAHMIDVQPDSGSILLLPPIVKRLAADDLLIRKVQEDHLAERGPTKRRPGWDRLVGRTLELIRSDDQELRAAAIRLVAHAHREDTALIVAALYESLRSGERKATAEDETAYLDAAETLLDYRFEDLGALLAFLNPLGNLFDTPEARENWSAGDKERVRAELYRAVIRRMREKGGAQATEERQAALDYGRAVIEKAKGPADLLVFFDPKRQRIAQLQREALQKADGLDPKPTQPWADLLVAALDHSDHMGVLEAAAALIAKTFTEPSEPGQLLAAAVARRLAQGGERDRIDLREKLATVLGRIGTAKDVTNALAGRTRVPDDPQKAVWARLIRALGMVKDGQVIRLRPYYEPTAARETWERLAVAETLGQQGFRSEDGARPGGNPESARATLFLLYVLHGWAGVAVSVQREVPDGDKTKTVVETRLYVDDGETNQLESEAAKADLAAGGETFRFDAGSPDPSDAVREEAAKSLLFHAGPRAAAGLARAAEEEGDVGAAALRTLGLQLRRDKPSAATALARLLAGRPPEKRLLATLDVIRRAPAPSDTATRKILGTPVVGLLTSGDVSEAGLRAAAATAAHLRQLEAFKPVYLVWQGVKPEDSERRDLWSGLLRDVIAGIAKAGAGSQKTLLDFERTVKDIAAGRQEDAGFFADALAGLGADGATFALKRLRAELAMLYVGVEKGRTRDQRRAELDVVIGLYRELAGEAEPTARSDMQRMLYDALHKRWTEFLKGEGEAAESGAPFQLDALAAAVASEDPSTAKTARDSELQELQKNAALDKEQQDRLAKLVPELAKITDASAPPPPKKDGK